MNIGCVAGNSFVNQRRHNFHHRAAFFVRQFRFVVRPLTAFDGFKFVAILAIADKFSKRFFGRPLARIKLFNSLLDILLGRHDHIDRTLDFELDRVPQAHVRRVRHCNHKSLTRILRHIKRDNLVRLTLIFRNKFKDFFIESNRIKLDVRNFELAAENVRQLLFVDKLQIDKHATKTFTARGLLLFKSLVQLILSDEPLIQKHFTNTFLGDALHLDTQNIGKRLLLDHPGPNKNLSESNSLAQLRLILDFFFSVPQLVFVNQVNTNQQLS